MGKYQSLKYRYVQIGVRSCTDELDAAEDDPDFKCAAKEEIDNIIKRRAEIEIIIGLQAFDVNLYHNGKKHVTVKWVSERYFLLSGQEILVEACLLGRAIDFEDRYFGSPPLPTENKKISPFREWRLELNPTIFPIIT